MSRAALWAALFGGVAAFATAWLIGAPHRRLGPRLRPYAAVARTRLARSYDVRGQAFAGGLDGISTMRRLFGPVADGVIGWFSQLIGAGNEEQVALRLRQAGMYSGLPARERVAEHRARSFTRSVICALGLGFLGLVASGPRAMLMFGLLGLLLGVAAARSRVTSGIARRRERLRSELYTFNQLIAMRTRVGGGVVDALRHAVERGNGVFVDEMSEILRLHASGMPMSDALRRASAMTPEPEAQRTYGVLAAAQERGADLGDALLGLSRDLRAQRRDDLQRQAARRRLWLVMPIVIILAPVLLLFIGAPVPSLIFGVG